MSGTLRGGPIQTKTIGVRSLEEGNAASQELARKLTAGEPVEPTNSVHFENAEDLWEELTTERLRLTMAVSKSPCTLDELSAKLGRSRRSVIRDVECLRGLGLVRAWKRTNPGHGQQVVVKAAVKRIVFEL